MKIPISFAIFFALGIGRAMAVCTIEGDCSNIVRLDEVNKIPFAAGNVVSVEAFIKGESRVTLDYSWILTQVIFTQEDIKSFGYVLTSSNGTNRAELIVPVGANRPSILVDSTEGRELFDSFISIARGRIKDEPPVPMIYYR